MPGVTVRVELKEKSYDIAIGAGLLKAAGGILSSLLPSRKICIVTDETVARTYLVDLMRNLESAGFHACPPVILPPGEETKNFHQLQYVVDKCLSYKLDRASTLVALGGGVVGDITGFAASIILRGINFVQIPTTLLAQVDSAVGGKTGINTAQGKNLVGSFYQPKIVLIDTDTLRTLPERELKSGYAEILKYALIDSPAFFDWLEENGRALLSGDAEMRASAIRESCLAKARIVSADEREEKGLRDVLNLGHTFGHALEAIGGYDGRLLHGEAVSIGMKMAFDFSVASSLCAAPEAARLAGHLKTLGLVTSVPFAVDPEDILDKMRGDKKNRDGKLTLVLARGIGQSFVAKDTPENDVINYLRKISCAAPQG
jgi:3-dehydroquinate synthase